MQRSRIENLSDVSIGSAFVSISNIDKRSPLSLIPICVNYTNDANEFAALIELIRLGGNSCVPLDVPMQGISAVARRLPCVFGGEQAVIRLLYPHQLFADDLRIGILRASEEQWLLFERKSQH